MMAKFLFSIAYCVISSVFILELHERNLDNDQLDAHLL